MRFLSLEEIVAFFDNPDAARNIAPTYTAPFRFSGLAVMSDGVGEFIKVEDLETIIEEFLCDVEPEAFPRDGAIVDACPAYDHTGALVGYTVEVFTADGGGRNDQI